MNNRLAASAVTISCVIATLFVASRPATAAQAPEPRATVGIADIDLASPAGRKLLNSRVRMAAARMCLSTNVEPVKVRVAPREMLSRGDLEGRPRDAALRRPARRLFQSGGRGSQLGSRCAYVCGVSVKLSGSPAILIEPRLA